MADSTERVAAEIRRYCTTYPEARDSLEGIAWWVAMQTYDEAKAVVSDAVELLVQEGFLVRYRLDDGSDVYVCALSEQMNGLQ